MQFWILSDFDHVGGHQSLSADDWECFLYLWSGCHNAGHACLCLLRIWCWNNPPSHNPDLSPMKCFPVTSGHQSGSHYSKYKLLWFTVDSESRHTRTISMNYHLVFQHLKSWIMKTVSKLIRKKEIRRLIHRNSPDRVCTVFFTQAWDLQV